MEVVFGVLALMAVVLTGCVIAWLAHGESKAVPKAPKPSDSIFGWQALRCRREILEVRIRHSDLLDKRAEVGCFSQEGLDIRKDIDANIAKLDEIETRYFGPETSCIGNDGEAIELEP